VISDLIQPLGTLDEWATSNGVHPETAREWARGGRIEGAVKRGRVWRVRRDAAYQHRGARRRNPESEKPARPKPRVRMRDWKDRRGTKGNRRGAK
jgi:hypothetical protein